MSESLKKPLTIRVPKPKSPQDLRKERISQWECCSKKVYGDVLDRMVNTFYFYINDNPQNFSHELKQLDDPKFKTRFRKFMSDTINEYVDFISGYSLNLARENAEDWKYSKGKLAELFKIYSSLSKKHRNILSVALEMKGYAPLSDELVRSFKRARMLAARHARSFEARGSKRSPASFLAVALFENLEICFKRELKRSFSIARGRLSAFPNAGTNPDLSPLPDYVFISPDAELIHLLARHVDEGVTAKILSSALRSMAGRD